MFKTIPTSIISLAGKKFTHLLFEKELNEITIYMDHDNRYGHICSCCSRPAKGNRRTRRRIRDCSLFGIKVYINFEQWEVDCPTCGIRIEKLDFVTPKSRSAIRFEEQVAVLCKHMAVSEVADYFDLDWKTVKDIDKSYLERTFKEPDLSNVRIIGVDEVARCKGHNYLTLVYNLDTNRLIHIHKGKDKESLDSFFKKLQPEGCKKIKAIAMDMNKAYISSVKEHCPDAKTIYDKFHIIANYMKTLNSIRRSEFRKANVKGTELLKGSKFLLLKNRENLKEDEEKRLEQLLSYNKNLNISYILKEQLQTLWDNVTVPGMNRAFTDWYTLAKESGIYFLDKFAEYLKRFQSTIFSYCFYPIHTAKLEVTNSAVGLLRKRAHGYYDLDYFILKIFQIAN